MEVQPPIVDLTELQRKLAAEKESINAWVSQRKESAEAIYDEHSRMLRENADQILSLSEQQRTLEEQGDKLRERLVAEAATVNELQEDLEKLQQQSEPLPEAVRSLQEELRGDLAQLQKRTAELDEMLGKKRHALEVLQAEVRQYQDSLGLELRSSNDAGKKDRLQLIFTQIDSTNPERQFSFSVCNSPGDQWRITDCQPCVPALEDYVKELNSDPKGFSLFVRKMRRAFKELKTVAS